MGSLGYLVSLIVMCLAVTFLLGVLLSYVWRRSSYRRMAAENDQTWLSRLRQTEQDRDARNAKLRSEVDEQRHQIPTMEKSLAERSEIINTLEGMYYAQSGTIETLQQKLDEALSSPETDKGQLEKISTLEADIERHRLVENKLNRELAELQKKNNNATARAAKAEEELETVTQHQQQRLGAMEERVGDAVNISEELEASQQLVDELQQEVSGVTSRLVKLEQEHGSCSAQLENVNVELKKVRAEADSNNKRAEELKQQLAGSRKEVTAVQRTNDELTQKLNANQNTSEQMGELNQKLNRQRNQNEQTGAQLSQTELRKSELEQTLRTRVDEVASAQREVSELRNATAELEARNEQLEEKCQRATSELNTAQSRAEDARKEFAQWRDQAEQLENLLQTHRNTAQEAQEQARHWQIEHDKLKAQGANESVQLEESRRQVQVLDHELKDARQLVEAGKKKQGEWQQRLEENEGSADVEMRKLKSQVTKLTNQVAGSSDQADEVATLQRKLKQRDEEFTTEQQRHNEQRLSAEDWQTRYKLLKEEQATLASPRKAPSKNRKSKKARVVKSSNEKPDWLLSEAPQEKDDLKKIRGVGPVMEKTMNGLGIYLFSQVAALRKKDIEWVTSHINTFPDRIVRDDWVGQALKLRKEKYGK